MSTVLFENRVALVTGGASGIGAETARQLARGGAAVVVGDLNLEAAKGIVEEIASEGGRAFPVQMDVTIPEDSEKAVMVAVERFGGLHHAVNAAGIGGPMANIPDYGPGNWRQVIDINLNGVYFALRSEIPQILASGGGSIVNISSLAGIGGAAQLSAYVASKHGVAGLTKSAALEYADKGVRINAVCPGYIRTPLLTKGGITEDDMRGIAALHPIGRLGEAQEVANLIEFLLSDKASFITGSLHSVDGGASAS